MVSTTFKGSPLLAVSLYDDSNIIRELNMRVYKGNYIGAVKEYAYNSKNKDSLFLNVYTLQGILIERGWISRQGVYTTIARPFAGKIRTPKAGFDISLDFYDCLSKFKKGEIDIEGFSECILKWLEDLQANSQANSLSASDSWINLKNLSAAFPPSPSPRTPNISPMNPASPPPLNPLPTPSTVIPGKLPSGSGSMDSGNTDSESTIPPDPVTPLPDWFRDAQNNPNPPLPPPSNNNVGGGGGNGGGGVGSSIDIDVNGEPDLVALTLAELDRTNPQNAATLRTLIAQEQAKVQAQEQAVKILAEIVKQLQNFSGPSSAPIPEFILPLADQIQYPRFTNVVRNLPLYIVSNPEVMQAIVKVSGLTEKEVINNLTFGQGPTIKFGTLFNKDGTIDPVWGWFNGKNDPNAIDLPPENPTGLK